MATIPERLLQTKLEEVFLACPQIKKLAVYKPYDVWTLCENKIEAKWIDTQGDQHSLRFDITQSPEEIIELAVVTLRMLYGNSFEGQEGRSS